MPIKATINWAHVSTMNITSNTANIDELVSSKVKNLLDSISNLRWLEKSDLLDYLNSIFEYQSYCNDIYEFYEVALAEVKLKHLHDIRSLIIKHIHSSDILNQNLNLYKQSASKLAIEHITDMKELNDSFLKTESDIDNIDADLYHRFIRLNLKKDNSLNNRNFLMRYLIKVEIDLSLYADIRNEAVFNWKNNFLCPINIDNIENMIAN